MIFWIVIRAEWLQFRGFNIVEIKLETKENVMKQQYLGW